MTTPLTPAEVEAVRERAEKGQEFLVQERGVQSRVLNDLLAALATVDHLQARLKRVEAVVSNWEQLRAEYLDCKNPDDKECCEPTCSWEAVHLSSSIAQITNALKETADDSGK